MKKLMLLFFILFVTLGSCENKKERERAIRAQESIMEMATPVEVRKEVCDVCRGTGKTKCKKCSGKGILKDDRFSVGDGKLNPTIGEMIDCYECDGYGFFVCKKCGGSGVVTVLREK